MMDRDEPRFAFLFFTFFLIFIVGAIVGRLEIWPYNYVASLTSIAEMLRNDLDQPRLARDIQWVHPSTEPAGVKSYDPEKTTDGYVLYLTTQGTRARLIDNNGQLLHEWSMRFNQDWNDKSHIPSLTVPKDRYFYFRDFHLYENGDILLMVTAAGLSPWGVGLVKLDKDSHILWQYSGYVVNDLEVAPDGSIYFFENKVVQNIDRAPQVAQALPEFFLEDHLVHLSAAGEVLEKTSLLKAIQHSAYAGFLDQLYDHASWDPLHPNSIAVVKHDAASVPWLKEGFLLLSIRNLHALVVFDPRAGQIIHVAGLHTRRQHDIDLLDNGHLMVFDNQGRIGHTGFSQVLEFDPLTQEVLWRYVPKGDQPDFQTRFFGTQQRLANGNTLIVEAEKGRIFEVTPSRDIVWDYFVPDRSLFDGVSTIATVTHAQRIAPPSIDFTFNRIAKD